MSVWAGFLRSNSAPAGAVREWLLVIPLLTALLLFPFWPVATMQGTVITNDIATSDMANLHQPMRDFLGRELHAGRLPLWLPDIYLGYPLQAEGMTGVFYPPNLLLFGLLPAPIAQNLAVLWPFFLATFATYALARRLGAALWPALTAALAYALGGFYIVHVKHMPIVHTACWIPLVWLFIELGLGRDRRFLLGVAPVWAVQWLAGMPQIAYYSVVVGLIYYLGRLWSGRPLPRRARRKKRSAIPQARLTSPTDGQQRLRRTAPLMAAALLLSFGLAALQIWPTAEMVGFSERAGGVSFEFATRFNYDLASLRTWLYPYANGDPGRATYRGQGLFWEDYAYIGLLPLAAGLLGGLWLARRRAIARLLLLLAAGTFVLSLGEHTPFFRLAYELLPGMDLFRFPQRLLSVTTLCLALLAALSLTLLLDRVEHRRGGGSHPVRAALLGGGMLALVVADLYFYHIRQNAVVDMQTWYTPPQTARLIAQATAEGRPGRLLSVGAVLKFQEAYRQAGGWEGDLEPYIAQREFLQPSLNVLYGVPTANGYANLTPDYLTQVWGNEKQGGVIQKMFYRQGDRLRARPGLARLLGLYHVRYLITFLPFEEEGFTPLGVYGPAAYLYENQQVLPRAFFVTDSVTVDDVPAALELLTAPTFDPAQQVILVDPWPPPPPPAPTPGAASRVEMVEDLPTRLAIQVEADHAGFLVLSDLYYPGWQATVDGQPAPLYQADACIRAVPLAAGAHRVEFRFSPKPLRYGAAISSLSLFLLAAVWAFSAEPLDASGGK